jgi:hypothetical protein
MTSPLALTLLVLPRYPAPLPQPLSRNSQKAIAVNEYASPLECVFCQARLITDEANSAVSTIAPKNQMPDWASVLLAAVSDSADDADEPLSVTRHPDDEERWDAEYSIVLPYNEE